MAQQKPSFTASDIWAAGAAAPNKQKPNQSKISSGWQYGEKPPHNEFNWWWELVGMMLLHLQQHGTPAWDGDTDYQKGALAWYNDSTWMAKQDNTGQTPNENLAYWTKLITYDDFDSLVSPYIPDVPEISELNGKDLLYVVDWNISSSYLHLDQVHVNTAS